MDIDLDLCEAELDAEVQNLRLLRKQMQSIQSIKTELRRKDNLIAVLKSKVISLETKLLSSEEEAEQLTTQLNTALHFHEADTLSRISGLQQQLGSLQQKIAELQEARDAEQITLSEVQVTAETYRAKYLKYRDLYNEQSNICENLQKKCRELEARESQLQEDASREASRAEELQLQLHRKSDELQTAISSYTMEMAEMALKNANETMGLQEEISRLRTINVEYEVKARTWRHAAEVATEHEKDISSRLQDGLKRFQSEMEGRNSSHEAEIARKDDEILQLQRAVDTITAEAAEVRRLLASERESWNAERCSLVVEKLPQLQKEIGALQMGVCLQKEMKDEAQYHVKLLKACLQSLSTDLAATMESASEETIYNRCLRLCGVFDRLLAAAGTKSKRAARAISEGTPGLSINVGESFSSGTEEYLRLSPTKSSAAHCHGSLKPSRARHDSVNIDPEFYAVIRVLRDLLTKIAQDQVALLATSASNDATRAETSILNDEIKNLRSDLEDSDEFLYSLTLTFVNTGFATLDGLASSPSRESPTLKSPKHRRALCQAKLRGAADEVIRSVFALRQELAIERDGADKSKNTIIAMLKEIGQDSEAEDRSRHLSFLGVDSIKSPNYAARDQTSTAEFDVSSPLTRSSSRQTPSSSKRSSGRHTPRGTLSKANTRLSMDMVST